MQSIQVRALRDVGDREIQQLSDVLIDCVEGGASVSFMLPIARSTAIAFWKEAAAGVARGDARAFSQHPRDAADSELGRI